MGMRLIKELRKIQSSKLKLCGEVSANMEQKLVPKKAPMVLPSEYTMSVKKRRLDYIMEETERPKYVEKWVKQHFIMKIRNDPHFWSFINNNHLKVLSQHF